MAYKDLIKLHGVGELSALLKQLPREVQATIAFKAVKAGAEAMRDRALGFVPVKTGQLRRSLQVVPLKSKAKTVRYALRTGEGRYFGDEFYGSFVEFGHRVGSRKLRKRIKVNSLTVTDKRGRKRKKGIFQVSDDRAEVPPNPFLERGFKAGRAAAVGRIIEVTRQQLIKRAKAAGGIK